MPSGDHFPSSEKRRHSRQKTKRKIYLVEGMAAQRCSLIDIAKGGARVALSGARPVGDAPFLVDPGTHIVHLTRQVWRSDIEIGFQFVRSMAFAPPLAGPKGAVQVVEVFIQQLAQEP